MKVTYGLCGCLKIMSSNIHGISNDVNDDWDDIICPVSRKHVVIPALLSDGVTYDMFSLLKHRYDGSNGDNLKSPVTGFECKEQPILEKSLFEIMNKNSSIEKLRIEIGSEFEFSNSSLYNCIQYLCNEYMHDSIIKFYGVPNTWNVSGVTSLMNTLSVFNNADTFDYDISSWDLSNINKSGVGYFTNVLAGNYMMDNEFAKNLNDEQYELLLKSIDTNETQKTMKPRIRRQMLKERYEKDLKDLEDLNVGPIQMDTRSKVRERMANAAVKRMNTNRTT